MSTTPPSEDEEVAESAVTARRGDGVALVGGYVVTGVLFVGATGLDWSVAMVGLLGGAIVRAIYIGVRNRRGGSRPFLSPWALLLASFVAAFSLAGTRISEREEADTAVASMCVDGAMQTLDGMPRSEWRFSRPDYEKFLNRYCEEAIDRAVVLETVALSQAALVELRDSIIAAMLKSGEIHEL